MNFKPNFMIKAVSVNDQLNVYALNFTQQLQNYFYMFLITVFCFYYTYHCNLLPIVTICNPGALP